LIKLKRVYYLDEGIIQSNKKEVSLIFLKKDIRFFSKIEYNYHLYKWINFEHIIKEEIVKCKSSDIFLEMHPFFRQDTSLNGKFYVHKLYNVEHNTIRQFSHPILRPFSISSTPSLSFLCHHYQLLYFSFFYWYWTNKH